jgi:hypothetical protein
MTPWLGSRGLGLAAAEVSQCDGEQRLRLGLCDRRYSYGEPAYRNGSNVETAGFDGRFPMCEATGCGVGPHQGIAG